MMTLIVLLRNNGLPDRPIVLIEPHRNHAGNWRIKFWYEDLEPLSMDAQQALKLALELRHINEEEMAGEIDEAVRRAKHYDSM
ncbi:MAG: hypothetical protein NVSMB20_19320 [Bradyrhizobium sp.]